MTLRISHVVPVEAVRQGITSEGAVTLARLAADGAELRPDAIVELFEGGWVASLVYTTPGYPARRHMAHVGLVWCPVETARDSESAA